MPIFESNKLKVGTVVKGATICIGPFYQCKRFTQEHVNPTHKYFWKIIFARKQTSFFEIKTWLPAKVTNNVRIFIRQLQALEHLGSQPRTNRVVPSLPFFVLEL